MEVIEIESKPRYGAGHLSITYLRRLSSGRWSQLKVALMALSLLPLLVSARYPLVREALVVLSSISGKAAVERERGEIGLKKREVEEKIKQVCQSLHRGGEFSPQLRNPSEIFLRVRDAASRSGVLVVSFDGRDSGDSGADDSSFRMGLAGKLSDVIALFEGLVGLVEGLELVSWTIERSDPSTEGLRAEIQLRRSLIETGGACS